MKNNLTLKINNVENKEICLENCVIAENCTKITYDLSLKKCYAILKNIDNEDYNDVEIIQQNSLIYDFGIDSYFCGNFTASNR